MHVCHKSIKSNVFLFHGNRPTNIVLEEEETYFKNPIYDGASGLNTAGEESRVPYDTVLDTPSSFRIHGHKRTPGNGRA